MFKIEFKKLMSLLLAIITFIQLAQAQKFTAKKNSDGLLILEGKDSVLFYQSSTKSLNGQFPRADYIHPLWNVDGSVITEDFPKDHLHHRGVFWAWHQVYVGDQRIGDAWMCDDFIWDVKQVRTIKNDDHQIIFESIVDWESPQWQDKRPVLQERDIFTVFAEEKNYRILDFNIVLKTLVPGVRIGGSEDVKGYGGFSVRMKLPEDIQFLSKNGEVTPETTQVTAGPWMKISGSIAKNNEYGGVVIIDHPENPMFPQTWILRKKGSMQNPVFPGTTPVAIPMNQPVKLLYRVIIYTDHLSSEDLQKAVASFQ